jgi:hypothetical protein
MLVREIIEMTKEKPVAVIARDHLSIGEKKLRETLFNIGGRHEKGRKGWFFEGNPENLEKSIYDFAKPTRKAKAETKEQTNKSSGETMNKNAAEQKKKNSGETSKEIPGETINKRTIKRASFDLDTEILKKIKIHAIEEDRKISDIVEIALIAYIEEKEI